MEVQSLSDIYSSSGVNEGTVFVVPKIRYNYSETDYLFLLYNPLLNQKKYKIKSVSVFGHFKFVLKALFSKNVLLHYHWFEFQDFKALAGMPWKVFCIFLFKLFGGTIVWTVHNLHPHDQKWLKFHKKIHRWLSKKATKVHVHCSFAASSVSEFLNIQSSKIAILSHPSFPVKHIEKEDSIDFLNSEFELNLSYNQPLILIFGNISKYKGIREILEALSTLKIQHQILIAGPVKKGQQDLYNSLINISDSKENISIVPQFIEDEWIPFIFSATDVAVFNFKNILTSGSFQIALDYKKTIIAPDKGCLSEAGTNDNVFLFDSQPKMLNKIRTVLEAVNHG